MDYPLWQILYVSWLYPDDMKIVGCQAECFRRTDFESENAKSFKAGVERGLAYKLSRAEEGECLPRP